MPAHKPTDESTFVRRFERLDDEVPLTDEEAKLVLADEGIDPRASLKRLLSKVDEVATEARKQRFARADAARLQDLDRLKVAHLEKGRSDLLAQLAQLRSAHPGLSANFRNFESMNDDDLRQLLAEIEELLRHEDEE